MASPLDGLLPQDQPPSQAAPLNASSTQDRGNPLDSLLQNSPQQSDKNFQPEMPWSSVVSNAVSNIPASAAKLGSDIIQPFIHPIDTAESLKNIGHGVIEKTGITGGHEHEKYADAVGQFFKERYGSVENVKKTLAEDPVGLAADLSMFLTGGGSAAARLPGTVGKLGEVASTVGRTIDPIAAAGNAAQKVGSGIGNMASGVIGGLGTHTGGESLRLATGAGFEGGDRAAAFLDNMRGVAPMEETVTDARRALENIRKERGDVYKKDMAKIGADTTVLDFDKVNDALINISKVKTYKGQVINNSTQEIRKKIGDAISEWKSLDPVQYHTAEGFDALKQKIGDIRNSTKEGTPDRVVANEAYHALRKTIIDQAPTYAKVMNGYEKATDLLHDIERTLSLNPKATVDTSLRKLQSILRDNVNTSYGRRGELAEFLVTNGAPNLMEKLAGQALKTWAPRGLGKLAATEGLAAGVGAMAAGIPGAGTAAAATLPFMSPRLMGEASYGIGAAGRRLAAPTNAISKTLRPSLQIGRITKDEQERIDGALRASRGTP